MDNKIIKTVSSLMIISILSKVLGFLREFVIAYKFGASNITDAFFISITIAITFFGGLILSFNTAIIPVYASICEKNPNKKNDYLNSLQTLLYILQFVVIIIFFMTIRFIIDTFFADISIDVKDMIINLSSIMIFCTIFNAKRSIVDGLLQYSNEVHVTYFCGNVISNIVLIIFIIIASKDKTYILALGYLVSALIVTTILTHRAKRYSYSYKPKFSFKMVEIKETMLFVGPFFLNICLMDINTFVDRSVASSLGNGVVSSLVYGYKLNDIFIATFAATLGSALYPRITKAFAKGDIKIAKDMIVKSFNYISLILIPISVILLLYNLEITYYLLERGAFTKENTVITANCLKFYSIGMIFFAFRQILYKAMLSLKMTKEVMYNSIILVVLNLVANILMVKIWGYRGIALATSFIMAWTTIYMLIKLRIKNIILPINKIGRQIISIFICSIISFGFSYILYNAIIKILLNEVLKLLLLGLTISLGSIIYLLLLKTFKICDLSFILKFMRRNKTTQKSLA